MGKNDKVLLDNGKQAQSSMQLYWNKGKQIEKKKHEDRRAGIAGAAAAAAGGGPKKPDGRGPPPPNKDVEEKPIKTGPYIQRLSEKAIIQTQKALTDKTLKIPGYSSDFISKQQIERNRKEILKRSADAQEARERKERREEQAMESQKKREEAAAAAQNGDKDTAHPPRPPPPPSRPPLQNNFKRPQFTGENTSDPFFKVTESQDYNPIEEHLKKQQARLLQPPPLVQRPHDVMMPPQPPVYIAPPQPVVYHPPPMVILEGESTVKKSKIDVASKKQLFVPRSAIVQSSQQTITSVQTAVIRPPTVNPPPLVLGGTIKNISHAPAPASPFIQQAGSGIVSNANNQELLKMFMSDIQSLNQLGGGGRGY